MALADVLAAVGWFGGTVMMLRQLLHARPSDDPTTRPRRWRGTAMLLFAQALGLLVVEPLLPDTAVILLSLLLVVGIGVALVKAERLERASADASPRR